MTVPVPINAIFVGHIGMLFREDRTLSFPVAEKWRHDLISPDEVLRTMLERISGHNEVWPAGLYHVYVNATGDGTEMAMDLPLGALEGLTDEELILLLTKGLK